MKTKFFLLVLLAAVFAGGLSAFVVQKWSGSKVSGVITVANDAALTFASFSDDGQRYPDLTYAAEKAFSAVVNIEKKQVIQASSDTNPYYGGGMEQFFEFFGIPRGNSPQQQPVPQERKSAGSGVIITEEGYIVTNNHVIENASEISVKMHDGTTYISKVIGADPTTDIALIKIEGKNLPTISFGNSDVLKLGEWVLAVGNPYGLNSTVTAGIVSAKGRNLDIIPSQFRIESFIQTDAAINPGNSGGALVNTRGELIGINTVIKSPTGSYAGYGFAVPSSIVQKVVMDLMNYGVVQRAMLGIGFREVDEEFLSQFKDSGITEKGGIYVASVDPSGAAQAAGIQVGDVITQIDGHSVRTTAQMQELMARYRPNDKVNVAIKRNGSVKHFDVVLRNTAGEAKLLDKDAMLAVNLLGGQYADINDQAKKDLKISGGIQVLTVGEGLLKKANIRRGYIITHINGKEIRTVTDLNRLNEKPQSIEGIYPDGRAVNYIIAE